MTIPVQIKLMQVLQERSFAPVGSHLQEALPWQGYRRDLQKRRATAEQGGCQEMYISSRLAKSFFRTSSNSSTLRLASAVLFELNISTA